MDEGGGGWRAATDWRGFFFGGSCEGKLTCSHLLEAPLPKKQQQYLTLILPATQAIFAATF